ncbi:MAG: hypothetical protein H6638_01365 [Ardenticatenales bacterium]|nr:hypothetical protein [Ardenticatenales bacterium]MCB9172520.1 hypothetical protein [Ardenticatenales bacterium]
MSDLRRDLFKNATRNQIERHGVWVSALLVGGAAALTALTAPWLAPLWLGGAVASGAGLSLAGARRSLRNNDEVARLVAQTVGRAYLPNAVSPELRPYVDQAASSAVEIITRAEQRRGEPIYRSLQEVVDTVGLLLQKINQMSERVAATETLFASIQRQSKQLPGGRLANAEAQALYERTLFNLQKNIDSARQQVVDAVAAMQQISLQTLMLEAQDAALFDGGPSSALQLATEQATLLQTRIDAMDEMAFLTESETSRLLSG